jgi:voltage-gated potassium channel
MDPFFKLHARFMSLRNRFGRFWPLVGGFLGLAVVFFAGVCAYVFVEGWSLGESMYMVIITLSTVGFQEVKPLTQEGRVVTSLLILGGVGSFAYLVGTFTQVIVEGRFQAVLGRRRVQKKIDSLEEHFIVCGFGRIGSIVAREIAREGLPVVVIERDDDLVEEYETEDILFVSGDATSDDSLLQAGIKRASSLITALTQEANNVYVTLTARQLNPTLNIIARADSQTHVPRLQRAGADRVVTPHIIGGVRMAQTVLRPAVTNFLDLAARGENIDLSMEELLVSDTSQLAGKDLRSSEIRPKFDIIIIAIKKQSGQMIFNPGPQTIINPGDTLITVGKQHNLRSLRKII